MWFTNEEIGQGIDLGLTYTKIWDRERKWGLVDWNSILDVDWFEYWTNITYMEPYDTTSKLANNVQHQKNQQN